MKYIPIFPPPGLELPDSTHCTWDVSPYTLYVEILQSNEWHWRVCVLGVFMLQEGAVVNGDFVFKKGLHAALSSLLSHGKAEAASVTRPDTKSRHLFLTSQPSEWSQISVVYKLLGP